MSLVRSVYKVSGLYPPVWISGRYVPSTYGLALDQELCYIQKMVQKSKPKRSSVTQGVLPLNGHGGRRVGAGRPRVAGSGVSHLRRPLLASRHPVHVTARVGDGLASLRRRDVFKLVQRALVDGVSRQGFRVVEFSVQSNHIHLLCEGKDRVPEWTRCKGRLCRSETCWMRMHTRLN